MSNQFPFYVSDEQATFYIGGQWWSVSKEHKNFKKIVSFAAGSDLGDGSEIVNLISDEAFLKEVSGGRISVVKGTICLDGTALTKPWHDAVRNNPDVARILVLKEGDLVQVQGDEDAPDGEYPINSIDLKDVEKSIYLETDDGFFGFVANTSIKGFRHA